MPLSFSHEATSLIYELADPIPPPLRDRFLKRVRGLLSGDDIFAPAKIVAACAEAQRELMFAPPIVVDESRPAPSKLRSPYQRRAR